MRRAGPGRHRLDPALLASAGLLAVTASWGSTFVLIKGVVARMPAADFLAVRFLLAAVALAALRPRALLGLSARQRRRGVALGAVYGAAQLLQTVGLQHTPAAVSGFVTGMYVVLTPLLAGVLLRRPTGRLTWLAVALATLGLAVLALRGFAVGYGEALTLTAAALYAAHIVGLGAWSRGPDAYGLAVVQTATIAAVCTAAALPGGLSAPPGAAWLGVVYTALVAGAAALLVQTWAQAHLAPARAAVIMTAEPVFAAVFAVGFGGEPVTARLLGGGALVVAAMYLAELGPRRGAEAEVVHPGPV